LSSLGHAGSLGIWYIVWVAIYLTVVEFVIFTPHPCVSAAERVVCSGLVGPAVVKTHAQVSVFGLLVWSPSQLQ
jgi:hypothetical protein